MASVVPPWITPALIERTQHVWQPYYGYFPSETEATEILMSMGALCDVLFFNSGLDNDANPDPPAMPKRKST